MKLRNPKILIGVLSLFVLIAIVVNLAVGAYPVSISELVRVLIHGNDIDPVVRSVVFDIRLPRLMLGIAIGVALSSATAVMQTSMKNALADPALLGLAAASALGVVVALVLGFKFGSFGAFAFSLIFTFIGFLLLLVGHFGGRRMAAQETLLIGVALGALFLGFLGIIATTLDDPQLRAMTLWSFGSLALASQTTATIALVGSIVGFVIAMAIAPKLDLLLLGDRAARLLGVNTRSLRMVSLLLIALLVSAGVFAAGVIAFLGLFSVTIARTFVGPRHRALLPVSALMSVLTILICDLLARVIASPLDLPIGFFTALIGAPVLIFTLVRNENG